MTGLAIATPIDITDQNKAGEECRLDKGFAHSGVATARAKREKSVEMRAIPEISGCGAWLL